MRYVILFAFLLVSCRDETEPEAPIPADVSAVLELRAQAEVLEAQELAKSPYRCFLLQGTLEADPTCVEFISSK